MILLALALQSAASSMPADAGPLGPIGRQELPQQGCAAYLWSRGPAPRLVAMAQADPAQLRLSLDGKAIDVVRSAGSGAGGFGFAERTEFRGGDVTATLDMSVTTRDDLSSGAMVPDATLRIDRPGRDSVVVPVAGLIGCARR